MSSFAKSSAIHEAGHALMATAIGGHVDHVKLHPYSGGVCTISTPSWWDLSREMLRLRIRSGLAGVAAEKIVTGRPPNRDGASSDMLSVQKIAERLRKTGLRRAAATILREERAVAEAYLSTHQQQLEHLADELFARKNMTGDEVRAVLGPVKACNQPATAPKRRRYERAS